MTIATQTAKTREILRKGFLAYIGLYGAAFERLKPRLDEVNEKTTDVFGDLVNKGEELEATAQETIQSVRSRATETYAPRIEKVRNVLPKFGSKSSNDNTRVAELESEIEALSKKVTSLSKKVSAQTRSTTTRAQKAA